MSYGVAAQTRKFAEKNLQVIADPRYRAGANSFNKGNEEFRSSPNNLPPFYINAQAQNYMYGCTPRCSKAKLEQCTCSVFLPRNAFFAKIRLRALQPC